MNYSLETSNEASVVGWVGGWVVLQVKAAGTLPKEQYPPPLISPLLFTSLFLIHLFISPAPPSLHPVFLFFNLSFLSLPPSSFQMPDPHVHSFVYQLFFKNGEQNPKRNI